MRAARFVLLTVVLAGALGACGDDSNDSPSASGGEENLQEQTTGTRGECAETDLTFTNNDTGDTLELDNTAAVSLESGAAYTAYAADFEIDPDDLSGFRNPAVPEGANLVTVFVTVFNSTEDLAALEPDTEIDASGDMDVYTFGVIHDTADTSYGESMNLDGTITVTGVGDTFCAEIQYSDDQKTLIGTIAAPVEADF